MAVDTAPRSAVQSMAETGGPDYERVASVDLLDLNSCWGCQHLHWLLKCGQQELVTLLGSQGQGKEDPAPSGCGVRVALSP